MSVFQPVFYTAVSERKEHPCQIPVQIVTQEGMQLAKAPHAVAVCSKPSVGLTVPPGPSARAYASRTVCRRCLDPRDEMNVESGFVSPGFAEALKDALNRSPASDQYVLDAMPSRFNTAAGQQYLDNNSSPVARPVVQVLATALAQSRQTLDRLVAEKVELDAIIARENKQVERLEWLLERVQGDYSYFGTIEKMYEAGQEPQQGSRW